MTWKEYDGVPVALYQPGDIFGELEVYKNSKRLFSVISITQLELLVLTKRDFKKYFFRVIPYLGNKFIDEMENKFLYLERVMQMIVDCVFQGKNIFEVRESIIGFHRKGSLLKPEDKKMYLDNFLHSYRSTLIIFFCKINK
jgi:hypothetical protein